MPFLECYCMPGAISYPHTLMFSSQEPGTVAIIVPIIEMSTLRFREMHWFVQASSIGKGQHQDSNPSLSGSKTLLSFSIPEAQVWHTSKGIAHWLSLLVAQ